MVLTKIWLVMCFSIKKLIYEWLAKLFRDKRMNHNIDYLTNTRLINDEKLKPDRIRIYR